MGTLWALTARELKAFWYSPVAYVVGALFLFAQGGVFWLLVMVLNDARSDPSWTISQAFFGGTFFYWISLLLIPPALTMRTFSEEKRTGTIELLLTAPVSDAQVVVAKFLGAWLAFSALWMVTLAFFIGLRCLTPFDWAPILMGYLGTALLGAAFVSVGILASSLTRNQVISAVLAFVVCLCVFSIGILDAFAHNPEASRALQYLSLFEHVRDFSRGILDTRPLVLYLSLTVICLFFTGRVIGSPRWRS